MVAIADKVASKLEEKKGSITEDEVTKLLPLQSLYGTKQWIHSRLKPGLRVQCKCKCKG